jgi:hypothetical protein
VCGAIGVEVAQVSGVLIWDNEQMPRVNGLNIHKCGTEVVTIDKASRLIPSEQLTEDTFAFG